MAKKVKLSNGNDDFIGSNKDERILGLDGNDAISGAGGNDKIMGGAGNDTLKGGSGDDKVFGGEGNDLVLGGAGDDTLAGGTGTNTVVGGEGDDTVIIAAAQADVTIGQNGDEWTFTLADGTVTTVSGVEIVQFSDGSVLVDDLVPNEPGEGETFTLTANPDDFVGTANNDTFQGAVANLNDFDNLEGNEGDDTLNLTAGAVAVAVPAAANVEGIEVVNVSFSANGGSINAAGFEGHEEVWQSNFAGALTGLAAGATAGFRDATIEAADTITYATGATAANVVLDTVATGSWVSPVETTAGDLKSLTVTGDVGTTGTLIIDTATGTTALSTINLALTSTGTVAFAADVAVLTTIDASDSTGGITISTSGYTSLASVTLGSGVDNLFASNTNVTIAAQTYDLGEGNDVLSFAAVNNAADTTVSIELGAGNDTAGFTTLANITDPADVAPDLVSIEDFAAANDVLDISAAVGTRDTLTNTELGNIAAAATLQAALALVEAATTDTNFSIFEYGGDTYVFNDLQGANALTAGDGLLKLEGFDMDAFTGANLII